MYLILNFKTYTEASGDNALLLAEAVANAHKPADLELVICPQAADIFRIREKFPDVTIWAQHIDPVDAGKNTGWTAATTLIMAGANGTLINHSEHHLEQTDIQAVIEITRRFQLTSCMCVPDLTTAQTLTTLQPDVIAFEPPAFISSGTSLVDVDLQSAKDFVETMKTYETTLILGAGVSDAKDIQVAKQVGFDGVLLASAFVKATDPAVFLDDMIKGFAS